ncbi:MobA/MobL family protein [Acidimangrovimonas pyrenivorans]|uniref:MobA/MobL family protein n=1 Tax=Acidimangrovimonas pyrenivorans TaxID=2030798 RepID=A0ABV7ABX1_9RHOB
MIHPASHFSLHHLTRGKTASSIARAAYIGRRRLRDDRTGRTFSYLRKRGLLEEGLTNWTGRVEGLWNAVEACETRCNARVAREFRAALPAELPLAEQRRVVHGFTCFLKDTYGMAVYWAIHAPHYHDEEIGRGIDAQLAKGTISPKEYVEVLADPAMTNRNFHVHMLTSTRRRQEPGDGFGAKVRKLDDKKKGPVELKMIRAEWQKRVNAALRHVGSSARIDLRSYAEMAEAGDAPPGLTSGCHRGPAATAIIRRKARTEKSLRASGCAAPKSPEPTPQDPRDDAPPGAVDQESRSEHDQLNEELWETWSQLRALERERARVADEGQRIAFLRERARKEEARKERARLARVETAEEAKQAACAAFHLSAPGELGDWGKVLAAVARGEFDQGSPADEAEIDPETYEMPIEPKTSGVALVVRLRNRGYVRVR